MNKTWENGNTVQALRGDDEYDDQIGEVINVDVMGDVKVKFDGLPDAWFYADEVKAPDSKGRKSLAQAQKDYAYICDVFGKSDVDGRRKWFDTAELHEMAYRHVFNISSKMESIYKIVLCGIDHHIGMARFKNEPELETDETLKAIMKRWNV